MLHHFTRTLRMRISEHERTDCQVTDVDYQTDKGSEFAV